jgi:hypothetical protein
MNNVDYAFIKNGIVVNIAVFEKGVTPEILELFKNENNLDAIVLADKNACIQGSYTNGEFIPVPPFPSWIWNKITQTFDPPIPMPLDKGYSWNEETQQWDTYEG